MQHILPEHIKHKDIFDGAPFDIHFNGIHVRMVRFTMMSNNSRPWMIPFHAHENYEFHYVSSGEGTVDIESTSFFVKKGDFYITAPYVRHRQTSDQHAIMEEYCIECSIDFSETQCPAGERDVTADEVRQLQVLSTHSLYTHFKYTDDIMNRIIKMQETVLHREFGFWLQFQAIATTVLLDSLTIAYTIFDADKRRESKNTDRSRTIKIKNYLDSNLCNQITINDVAKVLYLSPRQIDRILVKEFGVSFYKYLTNLRMKMAIRLLEQGADTAGNIAADSGFSSYQQMYRVLKRNGYSPPGEFRKGIRTEEDLKLKKDVTQIINKELDSSEI